MDVTLAPRVRIERHTARQRLYLPRARRAEEELKAHARAHDQAWLRASIDRRLRELGTTLLRSPYYAATLRRAGLSPHDLRSTGDLAHFPSLDRDTLKERWADIPAVPSRAAGASELVAVQSSGSTGDPVTVVKDGYDCLHMWAVLRFWARWTGVTLPDRPRVVLLCSLTNGIEYSVRLPLLDDGALHRISLVRPRPQEKLRRAHPDVIFSDPAGLHWLAAQGDLEHPRLVLTSAQYFSPRQRQDLQRVLPVPVVNYYASSDAGPMAWECLVAPGCFHVLLPDVWIESVGGEIVVTRLRKSVLPLLRYRTGDRGEVAPDACACGYRGWSITGFAGRRECLFVNPQGQPVDAWKLVWLFKHYPLRSFRLTQRAEGRFDLEVVAGAAFDAGDLLVRLQAALVLQGWEWPGISFRTVTQLETRGEKPEPFRRLA